MKWIFDVEDLSVSRRALSNTSENDWVEVYSSLLQNTHASTHPHTLTHPLITINKNTLDILNKKVCIVKSGGNMICHLLLLFGLVRLSSRFLTLSVILFFFLECISEALIFSSCSHIYLIYDMLTGSWHGISQLHMFAMSRIRGNVTLEEFIL